MDRTRRAQRSQRVRTLSVWAASGLFTAWVVGWRTAHDSRLGYVMILMFLLALACTFTLTMKIGDYAELRRAQAERALNADQILKAMSDMAEALTSARLSEADGAEAEPEPPAGPTESDPRLRLVVTGRDTE